MCNCKCSCAAEPDWEYYKVEVRVYGTDGKLLARNKDALLRAGPQPMQLYGDVDFGILRSGQAEMVVIKRGNQYWTTTVDATVYRNSSLHLVFRGDRGVA